MITFYHSAFSAHNITVITPDEKEQDYIHDKYMGELVNGIIRETTKQELLKIARNLKERSEIQGIVLGGTELPLILKATDLQEIPLIDTTQIHVEKILQKLAQIC